MMHSLAHSLSDDELLALVRRMELTSSLVRRHLEEEIIRLVNLPSDYLEQALADFCGDQDQDALLIQKGWTEADLRLQVAT